MDLNILNLNENKEKKMKIEFNGILTTNQKVNLKRKNLFEENTLESKILFNLINFDKNLFKDKNVLDVCCGDGKKAIKLLHNYEIKNYLGIDIYSKNLKKAIKNFNICSYLSKNPLKYPINIIENYKPFKNKNYKFILSDISSDLFLSNNLINNSFDTLLLFDSITCFKKLYDKDIIEKILNNLSKKIKKNGHLIIELNTKNDEDIRKILLKLKFKMKMKYELSNMISKNKRNSLKINNEIIVFKNNN